MYTHFPAKKINSDNANLLTLVSLGNYEYVKQCLLAGWDPNVRNQDGITPAHKAAERNDLEMLKLLIDAGAKLDVKDFGGISTLKYAKYNNNEEMIQLIKNTIEAEAREAEASAKSEFSYNK